HVFNRLTPEHRRVNHQAVGLGELKLIQWKGLEVARGAGGPVDYRGHFIIELCGKVSTPRASLLTGQPQGLLLATVTSAPVEENLASADQSPRIFIEGRVHRFRRGRRSTRDTPRFGG